MPLGVSPKARAEAGGCTYVERINPIDRQKPARFKLCGLYYSIKGGMLMVTAIIAAAGRGARMGKGMNKVFISLAKRPLLSYTLEVFEKCGAIDDIVLVVGKDDLERARSLVDEYKYLKIREIVAGGTERQDSIANALKRVSAQTGWIVVHDGARPFLDQDLLVRSVAEARQWGAAGVAVPVKDTIKIADDKGFIAETPDRSRLWAMQTPQVFSRTILERAYRHCEETGTKVTDDAALVESLGVKVKLLKGDYRNIKITTPEDLLFAKAILRG